MSSSVHLGKGALLVKIVFTVKASSKLPAKSVLRPVANIPGEIPLLGTGKKDSCISTEDCANFHLFPKCCVRRKGAYLPGVRYCSPTKMHDVRRKALLPASGYYLWLH